MAFRPTFRLEGEKELQRALVKLRGQDINKALYIGFKRTATPIPGDMARAMGQFYTAPFGQMKKLISKPRVTGGVNPTIDISSESQPMSSRLFKPKDGIRWRNRRNVSMQIFKSGKRTTYERGFRHPKDGFAKGKPMRRKGASRGPFSGIAGPSFHNAFTGGQYKEQVLDVVNDKVAPRLEKQVLGALRAQSKGFIS